MRDAASLKHAQTMRKQMTEPETRIWLELSAARFNGIKFRRQKVIGKYIADFASNEPKLVIELDGDKHAERQDYDAKRTKFLQGQGYQVNRLQNSDAMGNMDGVLTALSLIVDELRRSSPPSTPSPEGEGALECQTVSLSHSGERVGERGI